MLMSDNQFRIAVVKNLEIIAKELGGIREVLESQRTVEELLQTEDNDEEKPQDEDFVTFNCDNCGNSFRLHLDSPHIFRELNTVSSICPICGCTIKYVR